MGLRSLRSREAAPEGPRATAVPLCRRRSYPSTASRLDSGGNLYIGEYDGARIRKVAAATSVITTYAGTGVAGLSGDGGLAAKALLNGPVGLAVDSAGNLDIADYANRRIRRVSPPALPALSVTDFAVPSFLGKTGFSSNTYLEIHGTNLAQTSRTWAGGDFNGANAPTTLDGVSVTVNGKPAFIYYVSPEQININTPDDTTVGPVSIQVKNAFGPEWRRDGEPRPYFPVAAGPSAVFHRRETIRCGADA